MKTSLLLICTLAFAAVCHAEDEEVDDSTRCRKVQIPVGVCAILYDDENCKHRSLIG